MRGERGFTLLEVIIALVIAGLALAVMVQGARTALLATHRAERRDAALAEARSRLAVLARGPLPATGETDGTDGAFHWHQRVVPLDRIAGADQRGVTLWSLDVTVGWDDEDGEGSVRLVSRRLATVP
jgi:general secretion pathway protein I